MSEATVLDQLEALRTIYSQRTRTVNSLIGSLRGVTTALTRANRALNDYATQPNQLASDTLQHTQAYLAELRLKDDIIDPLLPELRREAKALGSLDGALKDALAALHGDSVDIIRLDRAVQTLQTSRIQDDTLVQILPLLQAELQEAQRVLGDTFGADLRRALADMGVTIGGRPPRFEAGPFEIVANFVKRSATINYGKHTVIKRVPLSVDAVLKGYQRAHKLVVDRKEDGQRWMSQLYEAWERARRKRERSDTRANIADCYYELTLLRQSRTFRGEPGKQSIQDYMRAQFAYDFFVFTDREQRTHEGKQVSAHNATKSQTESLERSMWIVEGDSPHVGRYIADIEFVETGR